MRANTMRAYVFGANILENLTTGMYKDSKVIYREYIQNACDQIDRLMTEDFYVRVIRTVWAILEVVVLIYG